LSKLRKQMFDRKVYILVDLKEEMDLADRYSYMEPLLLADSG
jgi:hypothetical protein